MKLNEWAAEAYKNSAIHGFWDDIPHPQDNTIPDNYRATYYGNKLMLIVGEVAEAHEELRKNPDPTHTYYSTKPVPPSFAVEFPSGADAKEAWEATQEPKPEGLPFELADLAAHLDLDLDGLVGAKMNFNAKRPAMHGGKVF
jgi:hypothetical protein